jgi:signal transduction histidine kinase
LLHVSGEHRAPRQFGAGARRAVSIGSAVVVLLVGLMTYETTRRARESAMGVRHTHQVTESLERLLSDLKDAETGQRGYLLTDDPVYLEPYNSAVSSIAGDLARVSTLVAGDSVHATQLKRIAPLVTARLATIDTTLEFKRRGDTQNALDLVRSGRGKAIMDSLRVVVGRAETYETSRLEARSAEDALYNRRTILVIVLGALVAGALALATNMLLVRYADAHARASAERARAAAALELANDQLQEQATELEAATEELQLTASELELQVAEREDLLRAEQSARAAAEEARREAEVANRAKGDFLATMSHELRTPLNAIAGHVQLLEMQIHGPITAAQHDTLVRVQRASQHLLGLINDVLNYARLESGRLEYDMRPVPLSDIVVQMLPMIEPQIAAKRLTLETKLDARMQVWADAEKLEQVLLNLLSNAVKFTDPGGRITVETAERGDGTQPAEWAFVRVVDTGRGIPSDKVEAVFEPFVQVRVGLRRDTEGTGLGLAISRDLTRGMGGELRLRSTPGVGSAFTVSLRRVS